MNQLYFDGMAIYNNVSFPYLFLTFTSNSNWPEVQNILSSMNLIVVDRLDIVVSVFRIKFEKLSTYLTKKKKLGKVIACEPNFVEFKFIMNNNHYSYPL